ncbi:cytochrome P450 [Dentipellis sp. KUC8613]|nr:cytochrome P450 [Dentipellis sp. KUC8613]
MPLVIPTLRDSAGYLASGLYGARGLDFVVTVICLFLAFVVRGSVQRRRAYPPGPPGWPIVGNALQLPSRKHWLKFDEWSKKYGDVFQFSSLGEKTIVLGSAAAISELFDARGDIYSDRPSAIMAGELVGWNLGLGYANYDNSSTHTATPESPHPVHSNARFRALRKLFHNSIGPQACSQSSFVSMQEQERTKLLHRLLITGKQYPAGSDFGNPIRQSSAALILRLTYGYQPSADDHDHDKLVQIVNDAMLGFSVASEPGAFWVEYWPFLRHIPPWVPGAGFHSKVKQMKEDREKLYDIPFLYTKHQMLRNFAPKSMVSTLLSRKSPTRDEELIKAAAASLYSGGAETTPSTLLSFLLAMVVYPDVQTRAQAELDALLGSPDGSSLRLPTLDDRARLPYVNALIKEVWRWNPSVPLGLAHRVTKDDTYNGFFIEKGATVYANIWCVSILHDERTYHSPYEFLPERFLDDAGALRALDKMEDPSWTAFGFGRRICPGMHLADNSIFIYIASILYIFRIVKAVGDDGVDIEPEVDYDGFISQPKPFKCRLVPRSEAAEALVLRIMQEIEASAGSDDDSLGGWD